MTQSLRNILIVGGGSAGWLTAAVLAKRQSCKTDGISVTLIESSDIPTIGVGEGTWPTMRNTLKKIGISESQFITECHAGLKQGSKFVGWCNGNSDDMYYHPFSTPRAMDRTDLSAYWAQYLSGHAQRFADTVDIQAAICDAGLAPKHITTPEYQGVVNYGYHLDAGKFAELLKKHARDSLGVKHIVDTVTQIQTDEKGDISHVSTHAHGDIHADLFIDCSGFASLLLGNTLQVPFVSLKKYLFADTAIAMQVPYEISDAPIACQTTATAQEAGWTWDIALSNRRGVGYVYSSEHTDDTQAEQCLRSYVGPQSKSLTARRIPIEAGHRAQLWKNNCVAVGLSAGFLEPLEASALMLIELSAEMISERLPVCRDAMDFAAKNFNRVFLERWDRVVDFLKLHYVLSTRSDSEFWCDHREQASIPGQLAERLDYWRYHAPSRYEFESSNEVFSWLSYQYVLFGMHHAPKFPYSPFTPEQMQSAKHLMSQIAGLQKRQLSELLPHRQLLEKVKQHGFQKL